MKWLSSVGKNKSLVVFTISFFTIMILCIFSVGRTRLAELINNKIIGETKRRLINDIVVVSKTMNLDYQLGWKIRRDIRRIIDQSQKVISPRDFIEAKLKRLLKNKFYSKLPGLSWRFYEYTVPADYAKQILKERDLVEKFSHGYQIDKDLDRYMMLVNIKNFADKKFNYKLNALVGKKLEENLDRGSYEASGGLSRAATGKFSTIYVKGKTKQYFWSPFFFSNWVDNPKRLGKMNLLNGDPRDLNFVQLLGAISVVYDSKKIRSVEEQVLLKAAAENFAEDGLFLKFSKAEAFNNQSLKGIRSSFIKESESNRSGFIQVGNELQTQAEILLRHSISVNLSRRLPASTKTIGGFSPILFTLLCCWVFAIIWGTGCYFVMNKKVTLGLKTQVSVIIFILLFPPTFLGWEMMERYLEEKEQRTLQKVQNSGVQTLRNFEAGLGLYKSWVCAELDKLITSSKLRDQLLKLKKYSGKSVEKTNFEDVILKSISDAIFAYGVHLKNIMILRADNYAFSFFPGNEKNDKRFLTNFGITFFRDALKRFNPDYKVPQGKENLLLEAQTEELFGYFRTILPERFFPFAGQTIKSLDQLKGWGKQVQLYHRFFGLKDNMDHVFQTAVHFPSLYRQFFRDWSEGSKNSSIKNSMRLIGFKNWNSWFLRYPFWKAYVGRTGNSMLMLYDYFPEVFSRSVYSAVKIGQPLISEIKWAGEKWFLFVQPSKEADEFCAIILVPLDEILSKLKLFKRNVQALIIVVFVLAIFLGGRIASEILKPIMDLSSASKDIVEGNFSRRINVEECDREIQDLGSEFNQLAESVESGQILKKFVGETAFEFVKSEIDSSEVSKSQAEEAVIMFVQMEDFKNALSTLPPQRALKSLNAFFQQVCHIMSESGGEINKFIGEKVLAVFYARKFSSRCEAVVTALNAASLVSKILIEELHSCGCKVKVGLSAGNIYTGIIGVKEVRQEQAIIGDKVNLAARLCTLDHPDSVVADINLKNWVCLESKENTYFNNQKISYSTIRVKGKKDEISVFSFS